MTAICQTAANPCRQSCAQSRALSGDILDAFRKTMAVGAADGIDCHFAVA